MSAKQKLMSLFAALALVMSLCAALAAPVVGVSQPTVAPATVGTDDVAGATGATWNITFSVTKGLSSGDVIIVTFPDGTTPTAGSVTLPGGVSVSSNVSGTTLILTLTAGTINAGDIVTLSTTVNNPASVGTKTLKVRTSQEPTDIESAPYTIKGIALSKTTAVEGEVITVTGAGYTAGYSVDVFVDSNANGAYDAGEPVLASATVDSNGEFTATFTASSTAVGAIGAVDGAGVQPYNTVSFALASALTLEPASGLAGSTVTVTATNVPNGNYLVAVVNQPVSVASVITGGTLTTGGYTIGTTSYDVATVTAGPTELQLTFAMPANLTAGVKKVALKDITGLAGTLAAFQAAPDLAAASFEVSARSVTLSPSSGGPYTIVTVSGTGFAPSSTITITCPGLINTVTTTSGSDGSFVATVQVLSGVASGSYTFTVSDAAGNSVSATFTVPAAAISVSPDSGLAGDTITVTGTGFPAYGTLTTLQFDSPTGPIVTPVPSVVADRFGNFTATVVVPGLSAGQHTLTATCGGVTAPAVSFTVLTEALSVTTGLKSIEGKYVKVWGWDAATQSWKLYDPAAPEVSDLASLEQGKGYWIQVSEDCTLIYGGHTYSLKAGWNLIGWLG